MAAIYKFNQQAISPAQTLCLWLVWVARAAVLIALVWQCCLGHSLSVLFLAVAFYLLQLANPRD